MARAFNVDPALGLSSSEILAPRWRYGANTIQSVRPRPAWRILIDQFASGVIALLAVAAAVSWVTFSGAVRQPQREIVNSAFGGESMSCREHVPTSRNYHRLLTNSLNR